MLNEVQIKYALRDLAEYGWVFLETEDHARQVYDAIHQGRQGDYEIAQASTWWRTELRLATQH